MSYQADIVIIGAGVVGLAIASEVTRTSRDVYLLEKNESFGQEQSSRNSEVIHAGIYYEPNSLKMKMCLEGNRLLYELCEKYGIAHLKCGKIIVATDEAEAAEMETLYQRGKKNGVQLKMLSRGEMARLEPEMRGEAAFLSPTTGIIDSYALMRYFLGKAKENGAQMVYKTRVIGIERVSDGYEVKAQDPSGEFSFKTRILVNCAGLYSDRIAEMAGIDIDMAGYRQHWCKGEYNSVAGGKGRRINHLIYPVPMAISVGVHVCLDVNWRLRLGPLFYYVKELNYKVDDSKKGAFLGSSIMKALSFIEPDDLSPESSGIMAMIQGEKDPFRDFVIRHEAERGLPRFINLVGIETPGLTASPAIAQHVSRVMKDIL